MDCEPIREKNVNWSSNKNPCFRGVFHSTSKREAKKIFLHLEEPKLSNQQHNSFLDNNRPLDLVHYFNSDYLFTSPATHSDSWSYDSQPMETWATIRLFEIRMNKKSEELASDENKAVVSFEVRIATYSRYSRISKYTRTQTYKRPTMISTRVQRTLVSTIHCPESGHIRSTLIF